MFTNGDKVRVIDWEEAEDFYAFFGLTGVVIDADAGRYIDVELDDELVLRVDSDMPIRYTKILFLPSELEHI